MRIVKCDVCGENYGPKDPMIEMVIPGEFIEENEDESIAIDVCGWPCVSQVVDSALNRLSDEEDSQPEQPEQPGGERFIAVPKVPSIDVDMDEKTLAQFTEQVTGVKRR